MAESTSTFDDAAAKAIISDALLGVEIVSFETNPAVAAGEHYLSTLLRACVRFRRHDADVIEETSLIIKARPQGILSDFVRESHMLVRELASYNKILPLINEILGENITPVRLGPMKEDVLVLEDLRLKGFRMENRVDKLDFEHAAEALKALADFHAASTIVQKNNPEAFDEVMGEKMYVDSNGYMKSFLVNTFVTAAEQFEKIPHLNKYSDRLRNAGENVWVAIKEAVLPRQNEINVFNHGDFWTTNILFAYDQDRIKGVRFVDFQFCRWGSPAFDLQMLFVTSLRDRKHIPKLTKLYLERLNTRLKPNVLTEERLDKEMRRLDWFGFLTAVCTMPICTLDPKTPMDFAETTIDDFNKDFPKDRPNPYLTALKDKGFLEIIPEYLELYEKMGLF